MGTNEAVRLALPTDLVEPTLPAITDAKHELPAATSMPVVETVLTMPDTRMNAIRRGFIALKGIVAESVSGAAKEAAGQVITAIGVAGVGAVMLSIGKKNRTGEGRMDCQPAGSAPLDPVHVNRAIAQQLENFRRDDEARPFLSKTTKELRKIRKQEHDAAERALRDRRAAEERGDMKAFWHYEAEAHRHYRLKSYAEDIVVEIRQEKL